MVGFWGRWVPTGAVVAALAVGMSLGVPALAHGRGSGRPPEAGGPAAIRGTISAVSFALSSTSTSSNSGSSTGSGSASGSGSTQGSVALPADWSPGAGRHGPFGGEGPSGSKGSSQGSGSPTLPGGPPSAPWGKSVDPLAGGSQVDGSLTVNTVQGLSVTVEILASTRFMNVTGAVLASGWVGTPVLVTTWPVGNGGSQTSSSVGSSSGGTPGVSSATTGPGGTERAAVNVIVLPRLPGAAGSGGSGGGSGGSSGSSGSGSSG